MYLQPEMHFSEWHGRGAHGVVIKKPSALSPWLSSLGRRISKSVPDKTQQQSSHGSRKKNRPFLASLPRLLVLSEACDGAVCQRSFMHCLLNVSVPCVWLGMLASGRTITVFGVESVPKGIMVNGIA